MYCEARAVCTPGDGAHHHESRQCTKGDVKVARGRQPEDRSEDERLERRCRLFVWSAAAATHKLLQSAHEGFFLLDCGSMDSCRTNASELLS